MRTPADEGIAAAKQDAAFNEAMVVAYESLLKVSQVWNERAVTNYPAYLPSFDQFCEDFIQMTQPKPETTKEEATPPGFDADDLRYDIANQIAALGLVKKVEQLSKLCNVSVEQIWSSALEDASVVRDFDAVVEVTNISIDAEEVFAQGGKLMVDFGFASEGALLREGDSAQTIAFEFSREAWGLSYERVR